MKLKIFAIHDSAMGAYLEPFTTRNPGDAIRRFEEAVATDGHPFNKTPADFTLFLVGEFDDETSEVTGGRHEKMAAGVDFTSPKMEVVQ